MLPINVSPKEAVETAEKVVDIGQKISKALDSVHALKKEGQGIRINVPERLCQYDTIVKVRKNGIVSKKVSFQLNEVDSIIGTCMPSLLPMSIIKLSDTNNNTQYVIPLDSVPESTDYIMLQFQYRVLNPNFMANLVQTNVSTEPAEHEDRDEYWMQAAIKFPHILEKAYRHLILEGTELNVDIAIDQELRTSIPPYLSKGLRNIKNVLSQPDRNLAIKALIKYIESRRKIGDDIYSLVAQVNDLFVPNRFKDFVEVSPPFRYTNAKKGSEFFDFPGQMFPKSVTVISRTDLNLNNPAKEGKIIYKKSDMCAELEKFFK
ncbi:MAG: hypothetical protein ACFCUE_14805 [Candidatus Bathyarchaeia archaeon]|jgi:hypothetical protein